LPDSDLDHAILLDEAGIETGVFGEFRLKSAYSLVFARQGDSLAPVAVGASLQPMVHGQPVPLRSLHAGNGNGLDHAWIERLATELHLRNRPNVGADNLDLHLRWTGPGPGLQQAQDGLPNPEQALDIDPRKLVWQFRPEHGDRSIARESARLHRIGCRIELEGLGLRPELLEAIERLEPEIVAIDGEWFRRLAGAPAAVLLFVRLVERLKQSGAQVLVGGIETPAQLRVALKAEADLLQGDHLARPALAGTLMDTNPRQLSDLLQERGVVVPLFG
jgi:hypothetical protein